MAFLYPPEGENPDGPLSYDNSATYYPGGACLLEDLYCFLGVRFENAVDVRCVVVKYLKGQKTSNFLLTLEAWQGDRYEPLIEKHDGNGWQYVVANSGESKFFRRNVADEKAAAESETADTDGPCQEESIPCDPAGGLCVDGLCVCKENYYGIDCSRGKNEFVFFNRNASEDAEEDYLVDVFDPCKDVHCQNGGQCHDGICECAQEFTGIRCGRRWWNVSWGARGVRLSLFPPLGGSLGLPIGLRHDRKLGLLQPRAIQQLLRGGNKLLHGLSQQVLGGWTGGPVPSVGGVG